MRLDYKVVLFARFAFGSKGIVVLSLSLAQLKRSENQRGKRSKRMLLSMDHTMREHGEQLVEYSVSLSFERKHEHCCTGAVLSRVCEASLAVPMLTNPMPVFRRSATTRLVCYGDLY